MADLPVKPERTGWRDAELSARHRLWGFDAPCVDVDWVVVEYDHHKVMALIDYKHVDAFACWPPDPTDSNLLALRDLADRGRAPFFVVRYGWITWRGQHGYQEPWFEPRSFSELAEAWSDYNDRRLTEIEWVTLLYRFRGRRLPSSVAARLAADE